MRSKMVRRYYCDFCKKSGTQKPAMERHELVCFSNPNRVCSFCTEWKLRQKPTGELVAAFWNEGLNGLRFDANQCPACTLTGIIHARKECEEAGEPFDDVEFNYAAAKEEFIAAHTPADEVSF